MREGLGPHHSCAFGVGGGSVFMSLVLKKGRASREQVDLRPLWKQERKGDGTASFGEQREKGLESPGATVTAEASGDQLWPPVF